MVALFAARALTLAPTKDTTRPLALFVLVGLSLRSAEFRFKAALPVLFYLCAFLSIGVIFFNKIESKPEQHPGEEGKDC